MNDKLNEDLLNITEDSNDFYFEKLNHLIYSSKKELSDDLWERVKNEELPLIYASGSSKNFIIAYMIAEKCKRDNKSFTIAKSCVNLVTTYLLGISKMDYWACNDASKAEPYQLCLGTMVNPIKCSFVFNIGSEEYKEEICDYIADKFRQVSDRQNYLHYYDGAYKKSNNMLILTSKNADLTCLGKHYVQTNGLTGIQYFKGLKQFDFVSGTELVYNKCQNDIDDLAKELEINDISVLYDYIDKQKSIKREYVKIMCENTSLDINKLKKMHDINNEICKSYDLFDNGENKTIISKEHLWFYLRDKVKPENLYNAYNAVSSHDQEIRKTVGSYCDTNTLDLYDEIINASYLSDFGTAVEKEERELLRAYLISNLRNKKYS